MDMTREPAAAPAGEQHAAPLPDRRILGASLVCAGIFVFSLQDVIIKWVSGAYPVHEALAIRGVAAIPFSLLVVHLDGGLRSMLSPRPGLLALRAAIMLLSYTAYYLALPALPLASVVALFSTGPIFITALAARFLGEKVGLARWLAVMLGFLGVLVMLRPDVGTLEPASLLPLLAALSYAAGQIIARRLRVTATASVMSLHQNGMFLLGALAMAAAFGRGELAGSAHASLAFLTRPWTTPTLPDLALMAACGPISAFALWLLAQAYRTAEANLVATFEYTVLVWATLWGFAVWHEVPDPATIAGAALVIGAGLYVLRGGRRRRRGDRSAAGRSRVSGLFRGVSCKDKNIPGS